MSCLPRSTISAARGVRGEDFGPDISGGAEHAHGVVVREQDVFDRLVGDLRHAIDHLARHHRRGLGVDDHHAIVADNHPGIGIAFSGEGIEIGADRVEGDGLVGEIRGGGKIRAHRLSALGVSFPLSLKLPAHLWNSIEFDQARSVPPPPAVRDRQPLRHALRGTATSSILSWSCGKPGLRRRRRHAGCGAIDGAMGSHGPIEGEVRTDPSAAPAPGNQAVLKLEDFLPYQLNVVASLTSQALSRVYARRYRIGVPEWRVLVTLGQYGVMTGKAVGAHSHMHKTKVSRAVALLEKRRLLVAARQPRGHARGLPVAHRRRTGDVRGGGTACARLRTPPDGDSRPRKTAKRSTARCSSSRPARPSSSPKSSSRGRTRIEAPISFDAIVARAACHAAPVLCGVLK